MTASLKRSTIASIGWTIARVGWTNGTSFLLFVVLTRLLDPIVFGIFALSTVFVDVARILSTAGLADAVMREPDLSEETADTAFWSNVGFSCLVMLVILLFAGPYAAFMGQPKVRPVVSMLALLMPVAALGGIHTARLQREFGHKALALRTMLASLAASLAAIGAAIAGAGVWSLVVQAAVIDVAQLTLALWTFRWRPQMRFSRAALRRLFGFSASMVATQLLWLLLMRVPELFIGRVLGASAVGRFRVSWRLIDLLGQAMLTPMAGVSLVTLSRVQTDIERFRRIWAMLVISAALLTLPAMFGMGAIADDLIPFVFGPRWSENGDLVRMLALVALPFTVNGFVPTALGALGQSRALLRIAVAELAMTIFFAWIAAPFGLIAVAVSHVLHAYLIMPYQLRVLRQYSGIDIAGFMQRLLGPLGAAVIMAVAVYIMRMGLQPVVHSLWLRVLILVAFGCVVYSGTLVLLARREVRTIREMLQPLLLRSDAVAATGNL